MSRQGREIAAGIALILAVAAPHPARAQADPGAAAVAPAPAQTPIHIQYTAHEGCPDAIGFFGYVRARTQRVRTAAVGEPADVATIEIVRNGEGSAGTLELPPVDARPFTRRVEASTCDAVVLALSLILALAYDPDAITTFPAEVTAPAPPVPVPPVAPPRAPLPYTPPPGVEPPSGSVSRSPPAPALYGAAAGFDAYGSSGIGPDMSAGLAPFVEYGSNAQRLWKPRARASLLFRIPEGTARAPAGGAASLLFFGGQLSGCPISLDFALGVGIEPCLAFDLGQIIGSGQGASGSDRTGSLWWVALEAVVRVRAVVTGPVFAELSGSGGVSLAPGKFVFVSGGKEDTVFQIPVGFGSFGIGLGVNLE